MADVYERIKQRAHEIWEREGRPHGRDREHWLEAERELGLRGGELVEDEAEGGSDAANEGEGSRTAARDYDQRTREFLAREEVEPKAREAEQALEGSEGEALRAAEESGKRRSHGEDPAVGGKAIPRRNPRKS